PKHSSSGRRRCPSHEPRAPGARCCSSRSFSSRSSPRWCGCSPADPMDLDVHLPAILLRDTRAFGAWMAGAEGPLRDSLRSFARVVDVEAVLQETLLRVWQVAPRFVNDGKPNGLLRLGIRMGRNLAVSELRRTRARPATDDLEDALADAAEDALVTP